MLFRSSRPPVPSVYRPCGDYDLIRGDRRLPRPALDSHVLEIQQIAERIAVAAEKRQRGVITHDQWNRDLRLAVNRLIVLSMCEPAQAFESAEEQVVRRAA